MIRVFQSSAARNSQWYLTLMLLNYLERVGWATQCITLLEDVFLLKKEKGKRKENFGTIASDTIASYKQRWFELTFSSSEVVKVRFNVHWILLGYFLTFLISRRESHNAHPHMLLQGFGLKWSLSGSPTTKLFCWWGSLLSKCLALPSWS